MIDQIGLFVVILVDYLLSPESFAYRIGFMGGLLTMATALFYDIFYIDCDLDVEKPSAEVTK